MSIVGQYPESGVRVALERSGEGGPPWRYEGEAVTRSARLRLAAIVDAEGRVAVELDAGAATDLAERVRLIVRAAYKHTVDAGVAPPRRIARWRADR